MRRFCADAAEYDVDLLVFPELAVCGYPPEDLLMKPHFLEDNRRALEQLAADCRDTAIIAGFAEAAGGGYFNSLAVLQQGRIMRIYRKCILPNYGVFDERRYFRPGNGSVIVNINGLAVILTICEDIWKPEWMDQFIGEVASRHIMVNISASPFHVGKIAERYDALRHCATHFDCALAYCNLIGGQDELVFDGRSMFLDAAGRVISQAKAFEEDLLIADIKLTNGRTVAVESVEPPPGQTVQPADPIAEVYGALVLGTKDYVLKNSFKKVIIGLSGGIDSSLTAAIAVDALGSQNVVAVTMPSQFNNPQTVSDAQQVAKNLGIEFHTIPITAVLDKFSGTLDAVEGWADSGVAYENLQARIRGTILMAMSNRFSYLVLTTGNKSETAVGYSTLYGDTAGGFAVIKDVPKTMVYQLAQYVNSLHRPQIIPTSVIRRPPSAELKENQKDTDLLPEYDLLDRILKDYIEEDKSAKQIIAEGLPEDVVNRVVRMVDLNEYKRRQSPPGIKITPKAFGRDRRMPITNRYISQ